MLADVKRYLDMGLTPKQLAEKIPNISFNQVKSKMAIMGLKTNDSKRLNEQLSLSTTRSPYSSSTYGVKKIKSFSSTDMNQLDVSVLREYGIFSDIMTDEHFIVICKPVPGVKVLLLRVEEDAFVFSVSRPQIPDILLNELFRNWSESTRAVINTCYGDYCFCYPSPEGKKLREYYETFKNAETFPGFTAFKCYIKSCNNEVMEV